MFLSGRPNSLMYPICAFVIGAPSSRCASSAGMPIMTRRRVSAVTASIRAEALSLVTVTGMSHRLPALVEFAEQIHEDLRHIHGPTEHAADLPPNTPSFALLRIGDKNSTIPRR